MHGHLNVKLWKGILTVLLNLRCIVKTLNSLAFMTTGSKACLASELTRALLTVTTPPRRESAHYRLSPAHFKTIRIIESAICHGAPKKATV